MSPKQIFIRGPNWIGDQVVALPFYRALKEAYPASAVTLAVPKAVAQVPLPATLFSEVVVLHSGFRPKPDPRFDLGIMLTSSVSSARLLWALRIPHRVGYAEPSARLWLTESLPWPKNQTAVHKSKLYLDLLSWMQGKAEASLPAVLPPPRTQRQPYVVVAPGASIGLREWPYFQQLLIDWQARFPRLEFVVVGAAGEAKWHAFLKRLQLPKVKDRVEETSLAQIVSLCRDAALVVANDSGVAHLAGTLAGAPTLVLFGPGDPDYVKPLGPRVEAVRADSVSCSPCESARCRAPFGYQRCLRELSLDTVTARARKYLAPFE